MQDDDRSPFDSPPVDVRYDAAFSDLHAAVEGVHAHFQGRTGQAVSETAEALHRLRLAVHEWMANLVRHGRFGERQPEVRVRIWRREGRLLCTIEDNAQGFDVAAYLEEQPALAARVRELPESGGGLGLLLLQASTERMAYDTAIGGQAGPHNRLRLAVHPRENNGA